MNKPRKQTKKKKTNTRNTLKNIRKKLENIRKSLKKTPKKLKKHQKTLTKVRKTLTKILNDFSKDVRTFISEKKDPIQFRIFLSELFDGFLEVMKRILLILLLAVLGLVYMLLPYDIFPDFIPIVGWIDDFGVLGWLIFFFLTRRVLLVTILILLIPLTIGVLLGLIFVPLGVVAGIVAMLYGFWKIGVDFDYFDD